MGTAVRPARWLAACCAAASLLCLLAPAPARAGTDGTIGLAWDPPLPTDPHVDGWFMYWGTTPGGPYPNKSPPILNDGTSTPSYTMTGLTDCTMYYFVVTAFAYVAGDDAGTILESAFSNEVYSWPRPTITLITPATAAQQASISMAIEGTNFNTTWGTPTVTFDDSAIVTGAVSVTDCYHLTVPVDVNCSRTGAIDVKVTNPEGTQAHTSSLFSVTASSGCVPPDAGAEPPDAAAPGPDAAAPGLDAAAPGLDAAAPGLDAAAPGQDAAAPGLDAGSAGLDAATPGQDAASPGLDAAAPGPDSSLPGEDAAQIVPDDASTVVAADASVAAPDGALPPGPDAGAAGSDGSMVESDSGSGFDPVTVAAGCSCSAPAAGGPGLAALWLLVALSRRRRSQG